MLAIGRNRMPVFRTASRLTLALLAAAPLACPAAAAQTAPVVATAFDPDAHLAGLQDFVDGVMAEQIASREVAGAVVTVVHDGQILFTRGYGYADIDQDRPVDPMQTLFRPGSVSKLFTWTALMQQIEAGRVSLDDDVAKYLDYDLPPFDGPPIRVRDLFQHTPGLSDIGGIIVRDPENLPYYADWMKENIPGRMWAPGTEVSYSNYGSVIAGYIVERVSGEPFVDYVEKHIFTPLGMNASTFREPLPASLQANMARGYTLEDGQFVAQPYEFVSPVLPAGSVAATAPDMARFMLAMLNRGQLGDARILKPESVEFLFSDSFANTPNLPGMAHGFLVYNEAGPRLVGHAGNTGDFHSDLIIAPEHGFGFFVSTTGGQESGAGRTDLGHAILGRVFSEEPTPRWTGTDAVQPPLGAYRSNRRDYSKEPRAEYDLKVSMPEPHLVLVESYDGTTAWEQIGPNLYEKVTAAREGGPFTQLEFYGLPDNPRLSFSDHPYETYHFVPNAPDAAEAGED